MRVRTVRDVGALVRQARTEQERTQAELASALGVSRDWVVRLEKGHPRLEAQLVLDALAAVGVSLVAETWGDDMEEEHEFDDVLGPVSRSVGSTHHLHDLAADTEWHHAHARAHQDFASDTHG